MVYNFLCKDEKTRRNIYLLLLKTSVWKEVRHFFRTVYPNRNHVTTHPVTHMQEDLGWDTLQNRQQDSRLSMLYNIDHQWTRRRITYKVETVEPRTHGEHKSYQERTTSEVYRNSFPRTRTSPTGTSSNTRSQ